MDTLQYIKSKVQVGMTREEVKAALGEPDDFSARTRKQYHPIIYRYKNVELYFEKWKAGKLISFFEREIGIKWSNEEPEYRTGDDVWIVSLLSNKPYVQKTYIRSVPLELITIPEKECDLLCEDKLVFCGYYRVAALMLANQYLPPDWCHKDYIFDTEEEAKKASKWYRAKLSKREWRLAIGNRKITDGEGNIEDGCELTIGCVNDGTSEIRSMLERVKKDSGIIEVERRRLQKIIDNCPNKPEALERSDSLLAKLFEQIEIKW